MFENSTYIDLNSEVRLEFGTLEPQNSEALLRALAEKGAKGRLSKGRVVCWLTNSPRSSVSRHRKLFLPKVHPDLTCFTLDHDGVRL